MGFIGCSIVMVLYLLMIYRLLSLALIPMISLPALLSSLYDDDFLSRLL